MRKDLCG